MRLLSHRWSHTAVAVMLPLGALMNCGCGTDGASLWAKHFSNSRKADAQRHWSDMRGDIQLQLAENHFAAGRLDEAEKALEQATALAPGNTRLYVLATKLHLERGDLAKARTAVAQASALPGDEAEVQYLAGIVAERYGDMPMALEHYAAASMEAPQVAAYILAQAETLVALDRPIEAMELIEAGLEDFDGNAPMRMLAAHLNEMLGLRGPAVEYAREALRIQESDPYVVAEVGRILVWAEQYEEAVAVLRPAAEKALASAGSVGQTKLDQGGPVSPSMLRDLARAYMAMRQWREAQWALKPLLAQDENDVTAWCMYAQAALMFDDLEVAGETVRVLHTHNAPTPETLLLAAHIALRQSDFAGALEAASRAARQDERLATAHCLMGRAYEGLGLAEDARQAYAKAKSLDPDTPIRQAVSGNQQIGTHRGVPVGSPLEGEP